jgi:hypothetical protein
MNSINKTVLGGGISGKVGQINTKSTNYIILDRIVKTLEGLKHVQDDGNVAILKVICKKVSALRRAVHAGYWLR